MERGRIASYRRLKPEPGTIPLYFANNAIITNKASVKPASILDTSLILLVYAPRSIRSIRYHERSSEDIANHSEQAAFREAEHSLAPYLGVHVLIKNFGQYEAEALNDTVDFVRLVAQLKEFPL